MKNRSKFHTHRSRLALLGLTVVTLTLAACTSEPVIPPETTPPTTTTPPGVTPPTAPPVTPSTPNPDIALVPYVYDGKDHSWSDVPSTTQGASRAAITVKPGTNDLSALTYTSAKNGWGPIETNTSNGDLAAKDGNPIKIDGKLYTTGIGAHAASELIYNLNAQCTAFQTDMGVAAEVKSLGSVTFEIWVDGVRVFNTPVMTGATPHLSASVDLKGKQSLKLIVTDGGDGLNYDHADWAGAVLTGCTPTPTTLVYEGPLLITKGGVYSGNWESLDASKPAVDVKTSEPVIIENSNIRSKGHLINATSGDARVTVRNTRGIGLNPNVNGKFPGRFVQGYRVRNLIVEHNAFESTSGIYIDQWTGTPGSGDSIKVRYNSAKNIDGRFSNGAGGWQDINLKYQVVPDPQPNDPKKTKWINFSQGWYAVQFVQFNHVRNITGAEISWNSVFNEPGNSRVEDNINMFVASGMPLSPIRIHDNLVNGGYTTKPAQKTYIDGANYTFNWGYSGGGIITDGCDENNNDLKPEHIEIADNTVLETTNYGVASSAGSNITLRGNRVFATGRLADNSIISAQNVGIYTWNIAGRPGCFDSATQIAQNNVIGWGQPVAGATNTNNFWNPSKAIWSGTQTTDKGPIPATVIQDEIARWQKKVSDNKITVGP
jgi:NPCBM/NEW2 domain